MNSLYPTHQTDFKYSLVFFSSFLCSTVLRRHCWTQITHAQKSNFTNIAHGSSHVSYASLHMTYVVKTKVGPQSVDVELNDTESFLQLRDIINMLSKLSLQSVSSETNISMP